MDLSTVRRSDPTYGPLVAAAAGGYLLAEGFLATPMAAAEMGFGEGDIMAGAEMGFGEGGAAEIGETAPSAEGAGISVNLGGEGEIPGVINQNLPAVLQDGWRSSAAGRTLTDLQAEGHQFVISQNTALPFGNNSVRTVFSNNTPIGGQFFLGPGIQASQVQRILQSGGQWIHNGQVIFTKP